MFWVHAFSFVYSRYFFCSYVANFSQNISGFYRENSILTTLVTYEINVTSTSAAMISLSKYSPNNLWVSELRSLQKSAIKDPELWSFKDCSQKFNVLHVSMQIFLQLVSNTPNITKRTGLLAPQTAKKLKKEGTETEKRKIWEKLIK